MVKFYAMALKKSVDIPESKCRKVKKSGRNFLVGKYTANGKQYEAWRITGK